MDLGLAGKRALVTGSSAGLGEAIARLPAAEGAAVVVHGRDAARTEKVAASIGAAGVALGDLSTDAGADAVAEAAGDVDILVTNAGAYDHLGWGRRDTEGLVRDVRGQRRLGGLAIQPLATQPHYTATLAARHDLAVSPARDLAGTGVTSNVVSSGAILVDSVRELLTEIAPAHGWGTEWPAVEAAAVGYLVSPAAAYVSGATIRVDGGTIRSVHWRRPRTATLTARSSRA
ncbi:SDR family NAD(P)-dependent oxidoreductase [Amycolatopsis sp. MtRt-6]|uniref:SDR family NAD(P)-dependent oxidoreductase n=1 Tax=Amycolatopsis sp. MtRt-6 TaxID=2792782 RepID=UPI001A8EFD5E|nr:SDR family NAD(P)-dependent oxidoreductase [Amycolatopsis sp. MtRt-6]